MTVLDIGCAMGFFSLPAARMVGSKGKVVCVDLQEEMIESLKKRAYKAVLSDRIEARVCGRHTLDLAEFHGRVDLALAFFMVHEVPDASALFSEIHRLLKPAGRLLMAEPRLHVSQDDFERSVSIAEGCGFAIIGRPIVGRSRTVLLENRVTPHI